MHTLKLLAAASALALSLGSQATVIPSLASTGSSTFQTLSSTGLAGVASLIGGTLYSASVAQVAAMPVHTVGKFLAAGSTGPATLTFNRGASAVSFLWGSPDKYNLLTVKSTGGVTQTYTAMNLGFSVTNGDQSFSQAVTISAAAGSTITSLSFDNLKKANAFEVSNLVITTPVPEPETYALMLAGLGAIGFIARRQKTGR